LCVGNDLFYRHVESKALSIFEETLRMRWNFQNSNLKKELMDHLEGLFGVDTFNKKVVTSAAGEYLKYTRDVYRRILERNPRYECPPLIPKREWEPIIDDAKEKILKKSGEQITGTPR
jgi:hypothetical protein